VRRLAGRNMYSLHCCFIIFVSSCCS
jgi:hypothetical protein